MPLDVGGFPVAGVPVVQDPRDGAARTDCYQSIGATSTDGDVLRNPHPAGLGLQQWSTRMRWTGQGWSTTSNNSQTADWIAELQPVQGAAAPTANLVFSSQVNGTGYTAWAQMTSSGVFTVAPATASPGTASAPIFTIGTTTNCGFYRDSDVGANALGFSASGTASFRFGQAVVEMVSNALLSWGNQTNSWSGNTNDTFLKRGAAATLQQGAAAAASPVTQTLQAQGSRSGTDSNVGGADYVHQPGTGTGTGTLASLIFKSPIAVASGSTAQTQTEGLRIQNGTPVFQASTVANLPVASTVPYGRRFVTDALTPAILTVVVGGGSSKVPVYSDGTQWLVG